MKPLQVIGLLFFESQNFATLYPVFLSFVVAPILGSTASRKQYTDSINRQVAAEFYDFVKPQEKLTPCRRMLGSFFHFREKRFIAISTLA